MCRVSVEWKSAAELEPLEVNYMSWGKAVHMDVQTCWAFYRDRNEAQTKLEPWGPRQHLCLMHVLQLLCDAEPKKCCFRLLQCRRTRHHWGRKDTLWIEWASFQCSAVLPDYWPPHPQGIRTTHPDLWPLTLQGTHTVVKPVRHKVLLTGVFAFQHVQTLYLIVLHIKIFFILQLDNFSMFIFYCSLLAQ